MTTQELRAMVITFTQEELDNEEWKDIKGFEDYYQVSSLGRFKSKDRVIVRHTGVIERKLSRILKNNYYSNGYVQLILYVEKKRYNFIGHRVIAEHFISNHENLPVVNHINCIRWDNRTHNLEWCTTADNMQHMVNLGRQGKIKVKGEGHPSTNLTEEDARYIKDNYEKGKSKKIRALHNLFKDKIGYSGFIKICHGTSWKHLN